MWWCDEVSGVIRKCPPASPSAPKTCLTINCHTSTGTLTLSCNRQSHIFLKMSTAKKCSCLWKASFHCFSQWKPVNSSHGQLITAQNHMTSWPAAVTACCDELTGASNAVLVLSAWVGFIAENVSNCQVLCYFMKCVLYVRYANCNDGLYHRSVVSTGVIDVVLLTARHCVCFVVRLLPWAAAITD